MVSFMAVSKIRSKALKWSVFSLSYIEKGMLDRLLTYYDEKVRPADKRNFLADPTSPPVVINASLAIRHMTFRDSVRALGLDSGFSGCPTDIVSGANLGFGAK